MEPEPRSPRSPRLALALTVLAAVARLLPHPPNFTPVGGATLFGGAKLPLWQALLVPLAAMIATDPFVSAFYGVPAFTRYELFIYPSLLIGVLIGRFLLNDHATPSRIVLAALLSSIQFFVITNFGSWIGSPFYTQDRAGLIACFDAGLPFLRWTVAGDLVYTAALFGLYALLDRKLPTRRRVAAAA